MREGEFVQKNPNGPKFWRSDTGEIQQFWRPVGKRTYVKGPIIEGPRYDTKGIFSPKGCNAFLLGMDGSKNEFACHWTPKKRQGHALTFGTSRQGGKGTNTIIPALLTYAGSMVAIDPKGELAWITAERRRRLGQRVVIIDPWDEVNRRYGRLVGVRETTTRFNPLSSLRANDPELSDQIAAIADALIIPSGADTHWTESATELLCGLIAFEVMGNPGRASMRAVRHLLTVEEGVFSKIMETIVKDHPDTYAARKLGRFTVANRETGSIRSTAMTQTAIFDSGVLLDAMETDLTPFDMRDIAAGRVTVYLVIPPDRLQTYGRWLRMILTLMIKAVSRQARPPVLPVVFLVDEAGTLNPVKGGGLKMLEQAFGLLAGLGVVVWMFFQDLNQMKRDYPDSWETFIANSAVIQVLNARDNTTTGYIADYFGETITFRETQFKTAPEEMWRHFQNGDSRHTYHYQEGDIIRDLEGYPVVQTPEHYANSPTVSPHEIRDITAIGRQLVIFPGSDNYWCKKVPYYVNPGFRGMFRLDPRYARA